jgi:hypothetical protein
MKTLTENLLMTALLAGVSAFAAADEEKASERCTFCYERGHPSEEQTTVRPVAGEVLNNVAA